jgi:hypothetical protein
MAQSTLRWLMELPLTLLHWSNGAVSEDISNLLAAGTYTVTVTDANGCTGSQTVTLNQPAAALNATAVTAGNISCFSGNDGSIDVTVTGGTAPYSFIWNNGAVTEDLSTYSLPELILFLSPMLMVVYL